ncbi:transcription elongation factor A protein 1-like [Anneissia japonica]|uniref:transcription elongation factor A protein 1-like n=1 Tax=Anneissia japonica TaxID=1529436 RepID=UPI0014258641|nr:transcription elongation factor A protein 1-like [Anneissia japonica]
MTSSDVFKIGKRLEQIISKNENADEALDLLKRLKELPITLEVLQKTRVGMSVNALRKKSSNEEVNGIAKSLIKAWKKLLPDQNKSVVKEEKAGDSNRNSPMPSEDSNSSVHDTESNSDVSQRGKMSVPKTNDTVREKCRSMIAAALRVPIDIEDKSGFQDPDELGAIIEDCIYTKFTNTDQKYKNKVRSRVCNLKDSKNPELRRRVLCGEIKPEEIANMTPEEMASNEMKDLRKEYTKESIRDHQMAKTSGTTTDLLKCGKCQKRNCTYNQVQTRSADEPMTTFVFCNECGNRWKFC